MIDGTEKEQRNMYLKYHQESWSFLYKPYGTLYIIFVKINEKENKQADKFTMQMLSEYKNT